MWSIMLRHLCQGGEISAMTKFHIGVAPIKLEMGRYTRTPEDERLCVWCQLNEKESDEHVLIRSLLYCDIRTVLFHSATNIYDDFNDLSDTDKLNFILSNGSIVIDSYKACHNILTVWQTFTYV